MDWQVRIPNREKLALFLILAVITGFRLLHFETWGAPSCDYSQYRAQAVALSNWEIATNTPIAPGTSIVMALLSPLMPGPDPYLHANAIANLIASTLLIVLLWRVMREFLSAPFAAFATWLFVYNPETTAIALQPGSDALFVCCIILAFTLYNSDSPWAYAAAGAATLFRYHGVLAVFALLVGNVVGRRGPLKHLAYAVASVAPTGLWYVMLEHASGTAPYGGAALITRRGLHTGFLKSIAAATLEVLPRSFGEALKTDNIAAFGFGLVCLAIVLILSLVGLRRFWREDRKRILPLILFTVTVFILHTRITAAPQRYTLPVLWIAYMCAVGGVSHVLRPRMAGKPTRLGPYRGLGMGVLASVALATCWLLWPPDHAASWWALAFGVPVLATIGLFSHGLWSTRSAAARATMVTFLVGALLLSASAFDYTVYVTNRIQRDYAELKPFSDWYRTVGKPDDLILCYGGVSSRLSTSPCNIPARRIVSACELQPADFHKQLEKLDADYVLWTASSFATKGVDPHRFEEVARQCNKWFFDALIKGLPDWPEIQRFSHRGRTAIVFAPAENNAQPGQ